jgi:hypothetical protein
MKIVFPRNFLFLCCVIFMFSARGVYSQTETRNVKVTTMQITPSQNAKPEFPQWAHDLRRFDIILFGSFPFTYWFASTGMDIYRSYQHNWDTRYAPWPVRSGSVINMTKDEYALTLTCAVAGSIVMALVDYFIVSGRRNRAAREAAALAPGEVIIIRNPKSGGGALDGNNAPDGGSGGAGTDAAVPDGESADSETPPPEAAPPLAPTEAI